MSEASPVQAVRAAKLFRDNRSQAIRIPAEFEFSGSRVQIRKEGDRLVIESEPKVDLIDVLRTLARLEVTDAFPTDIDDTMSPLRSVDL